MARYNEILVGRYNRMLQKLFSMKGGAVAPQLASEIAPAFPLFSGVENRYLESWNRFGAVVNQTALAGTPAQFQLRNTTANVIAVIEKLLFTSTTAQLVAVTSDLTPGQALTSIVGPRVLDPRSGRTTRSALIAELSNSLGISGGNIAFVQLAANASIDVIATDIQELAVPPGFIVGCTSAAGVANSLTLSVWWRERVLEDSELS
jgi:hypothetical protein